jgi:hypothetical protein
MFTVVLLSGKKTFPSLCLSFFKTILIGLSLINHPFLGIPMTMETYGNIWNPPIFFSRQQLRNYHLTASPSSPGARSSSILPDVLGLGSSETWPETWPETS